MRFGIGIRFRHGEMVIRLGRRKMPVAEAVANEVVTQPTSGETRTVYVLLTRRLNFVALFVQLFSWHPYTHTAIALERDGHYYSFNPGGFTIERPISRKHPGTRCLLYSAEVPEAVFRKLEQRIQWHIENPKAVGFNYLGLLCLLFRIPLAMEGSYFCSQFVSELLSSTGAAKMRRRPNRYFPRNFSREKELQLSFAGPLGELQALYAGN